MKKSKEVSVESFNLPSGKLSHTPTPWKLEHYGIGDSETQIVSYAENKGTKIIARLAPHGDFEKRESDAAFIVRAVNAHDELIAALKQARESYVYRTRHENKVVGEGDTLLSVIDAALAKAEGVQSMQNAYSEGGEFRSHNRD
jgi:hypothetical protein